MAPRLSLVLLGFLLTSCSTGIVRPMPPIPRDEPTESMGPDQPLCRLPADLADQPIEVQHQRIRACAILNMAAAGACFVDKAALVRWIEGGRK